MNRILYLHGFNSSPESHKARVLLRYMERSGLGDYIEIPDIPPQPANAIALLKQRTEAIRQHGGVSFVGSSLGGFYATWLAEQYNGPAVLINPAVKPHQLLRQYIGDNTNYYTAESWVLGEEDIEVFRELYIEKISNPQRYLLLLQTGDETLDYREAVEKYADCPSVIEQGGSHAFDGFERFLERIVSFCKVTDS